MWETRLLVYIRYDANTVAFAMMANVFPKGNTRGLLGISE